MQPSGEVTLSVDGGTRALQRKAIRLPQLYLMLECERPLAASMRLSLADVSTVTIGRGQRRAWSRSHANGASLDIRVPDRRISSTHAVIQRGADGWSLDDPGSKNGTIINGAAQRQAVLRDGDLIELGHTIFLFRSTPVIPGLDAEVIDAAGDAGATEVTTLLPELARELARLERVATSDVSVLIYGETGTGKERIAQNVHRASNRRGAFVAVNCGALPSTLVESELFGSKKGAFSGATEERMGLVRAADKGTLFLDEIGDLPPSAQAVLLRTLQEREVLPVGATRPIAVDMRVVAATHHDLDGMVARSTFRADLLARLAGFTIRLPPLRERTEDLGLLIAALLQRRASITSGNVAFSPAAARALLSYDWPLNIRELEKALSSATVLANGARIEVEHLPDAVRGVKHERPSTASPSSRGHSTAPRPAPKSAEMTREELVRELNAHHGNISAVARSLGKARMQIQRWVRRFDVNLADFRKD